MKLLEQRRSPVDDLVEEQAAANRPLC